jgi:subtilisin-like proprotein convertase family protein
MPASFIPTDPLYLSQWHLELMGRLGPTTGFEGLQRIWADYRGQNINVGVWDDGTQSIHPDLNANYNAALQPNVPGVGVNNGQPVDPLAVSPFGHGTAVGGLIAADNNAVGGVGVAFDGKVTGVTIFGGIFDINTQNSNYLLSMDFLKTFDVTNHSYGSGSTSQFSSSSSGRIAKIADSLTNGRGGLGTIDLRAAGNSNVMTGEDWGQYRGTISVAALDSVGQIQSYSSYGSSILVSNGAGAVTTDLVGAGGYNAAGDYTTTFGGTSAATPITAGAVALMLSANPTLGWRDVQDILALSSWGTGSFNGGPITNENFAWRFNAGSNWNGGGLHYSEDYGFGRVNAFQAVRMAEVWSLFGAAQTSGNEVSVSSGTAVSNQAINNATTLNANVSVGSNVLIENITLTVSLTHTFFTDINLSLISPNGTTIRLLNGSSGNSATSDGTWNYTFNVVGFHGELSQGTWTARFTDSFAADNGTLYSINLTAYGVSVPSNDVYHYTEEALTVQAMAGQSGRVTLNDTDGGTDWIDAAAMYRDVVLNLNTSQNSTLAGSTFLTIGGSTTIENAVTGDGNDSIIGNGAANELRGMRGNDTLDGGAGVDRLFGGADDDTLYYSPEDAVIDGGAGFDTARASTNDGLTIRLDLWNVEQLFAGNGSDRIYTYGTAAYNVDGGGGNDTIEGNAFGDVLGGNSGNDVILGFAGNDTLGGGAGSDRLMGMEGADLIFGEADPDAYIYRGLIDAGDTIIGFTPFAQAGFNNDRLEIYRSGFLNPGQANLGFLDPNRFVAGQATLATGQFLFDTGTGRLFWDGDGTGAGVAQLLLTTQGVGNLSANDLVLV